MKIWIGAAVAAAVTAGALTALAQWPAYPDGGPRKPNGKPDLTAPTPRTADGKPDFTGTWDLTRGVIGSAGPGVGTEQGDKALPPPPPPAPDSPPLATFFNIAANMKGGAPLQPWAWDLLEKRRGDNDKDNPDAHCLPMGLMQFHLHPQPRKIVQTPKLIVIMYEANHGLRQIYLDGRRLPGNDPEPWWYGYSVGHWEGDTLVVETTGYRDDMWLDVWGTPMTSAGKTIERFRRLNYGSMQIDVTIDDPKAYTKPFTVRVNHRLSPDSELIEFICQDRDASHYVGKK
jgi:hypothetical protein